MPVDRSRRESLERIILRWARKELTSLQTAEAARGLTHNSERETNDKGFSLIAECISHDPQGKGFVYCRRNWKMARKWLAYLRSDMEPCDYSYRQEIVPKRLSLFRAYLVIVVLSLIVCFVLLGKIWLLIWPVSSIIGWIPWFGEQSSKSLRKTRAAYPFDSVNSMEGHLTLANKSPAMPAYIKPGLGAWIRGILLFPLFVLVGIPSLILILSTLLIISGVQGPFWLKEWTLKKYQVPISS